MALPKLWLPFYFTLCLTLVVSSQAGRYTGGALSADPLSDSTSPLNPSQPGTGQKVWCIGKPAADDLHLRRNIDYACGEGGMNCAHIQQGGSCYVPNTLIAHASYVMNLYYQRNGRNWWTCHFNGTGLVVFTDPSFGQCYYPPQ